MRPRLRPWLDAISQGEAFGSVSRERQQETKQREKEPHSEPDVGGTPLLFSRRVGINALEGRTKKITTRCTASMIHPCINPYTHQSIHASVHRPSIHVVQSCMHPFTHASVHLNVTISIHASMLPAIHVFRMHHPPTKPTSCASLLPLASHVSSPVLMGTKERGLDGCPKHIIFPNLPLPLVPISCPGIEA